jgi:hypothetical protein
MASAVKQERKVREVVEQEEAVVLTLTAEEARTLLDVMRAVGGCPFKSRRRHTQNVMLALRSVGVTRTPPPSGGFRPADMDTAVSILFNDLSI